MPDIHVAIRSYKRAGQVTTFDVYPDAYVWVPESQGDEYREHYGDRVITIPDNCDGNSPRKCNGILDRAPSEWLVMMDDDLHGLAYFENNKEHRATPDDITRMMYDMFNLSEQMGVELWGIQLQGDPMTYRAMSPFSLLAPVTGPFHGHLHPSLRYDERTASKDDYDYWLQNIRKFHRTLRNNKWHYHMDHTGMTGGSVSMRTRQYEEESIAYMTKKWGREVYRSGGRPLIGSQRHKNILYSNFTIPIKGV